MSRSRPPHARLARPLAFIAVFLVTMAPVGRVHAALQSRAGGTMYYDTVLHVTWLGDPDAIAGTPFDDGVFPHDGRVSWANAVAWADGLVFGGYRDWRLPTVEPLNGTSFVLTSPGTFNGTKDKGFNISAPGTLYEYSPASELAYMFYVNLGNLAYYGLDATDFTDPPQPGWGLTNKGPFANLQPATYWTGTVYPIPDWAFRFDFNLGQQLGDDTTNALNVFGAWAVRDGDVATVPEPMSIGLVGTAVASLFALRRRGKSGEGA